MRRTITERTKDQWKLSCGHNIDRRKRLTPTELRAERASQQPTYKVCTACAAAAARADLRLPLVVSAQAACPSVNPANGQPCVLPRHKMGRAWNAWCRDANGDVWVGSPPPIGARRPRGVVVSGRGGLRARGGNVARALQAPAKRFTLQAGSAAPGARA